MSLFWLWASVAFVPVGIISFCIIAGRIDRRHRRERLAKIPLSKEEIELEKVALGQLLCLSKCGDPQTTTATMRTMIKEGTLKLPRYITESMWRRQDIDTITAKIHATAVARKAEEGTQVQQVPAPRVSPDFL